MLAPLFIIAEIYGYFNKSRVYKKVDINDYDIKRKVILDIIFFFIMLMSGIWMLFGILLTPYKYLFAAYMMTRVTKLILVRIGNIRVVSIYTWLKLMADILILGYIFTKLF